MKYFLKSERIILQPIELKEISELSRVISGWINNGQVTYYMFTGQKPKNSKQVSDSIKKELETHENVIFMAKDIKTQKPIGYAGLYDINQTARKAEFRVLIGEKDFWGKGYGTEITELITYYGFDRLNLNRISLGYVADNKAAGKAYEKAGYVFEGTLKQDIYRNSKYYDAVLMAVLRDDYYKKLSKIHSKRFKA
ncbi:MAG: GNAT family protein [Patescibacteria group bacterium]